jgi:hypothetical protein
LQTDIFENLDADRLIADEKLESSLLKI